MRGQVRSYLPIGRFVTVSLTDRAWPTSSPAKLVDWTQEVAAAAATEVTCSARVAALLITELKGATEVWHEPASARFHLGPETYSSLSTATCMS